MEVWKLSQGRYKYLNQNFVKVPARMSDSKSDVKILVGRKTFYAHREVLSMASDYFECMFSVDMREKEEKEIKLYELDAEGFSRILDYFYRGYITIDCDVAEGVLDAASFLQCHWLITVSCDFLVRNAGVLQYEYVLGLADRYSLGDLHADIFHYLGQNFIEISSSVSWLNMSASLLQELLTGQYYIEAPEATVLNALIRWLEHKPEPEVTNPGAPSVEAEDRSQYNDMLLATIKYPLVESEVLSQLPEWVRQHEVVTPLLQLAENYQTNIYSRPAQHCELTEPRGATDVLALLPANVGEVQFLEPYSGLGLSETINFSALDISIDRAELVFWGNCLFVVGGYNDMCLSSSAVFRLSFADARRRMWQEVASMETPRVTHSLVSTDKHLYVIGGVNHVVMDGRDVDLYLGTVERYDAELNVWQEVETLPHGLCELAATSVDNQLYISGGIADSDSAPVPAPYVMRFDGKTWEPLAPMITGRKRHAMIHHENKLYVVAGEVAVDEHALDSTGCLTNEMYDIELNQWTEIKNTPSYAPFRNILTPATVVGERAFFLGGMLGDLHLLQFSFCTGEWSEETSACGDEARRLVQMRVPLPILLAPVNDEEEGE